VHALAGGAMPPVVRIRWTLVTLAKVPAGPTDFADNSSHGIAPGSGASARAYA
jgi:hypothetical protein